MCTNLQHTGISGFLNKNHIPPPRPYTSHNLVESSQIGKAGKKRNQILPSIACIQKINSLPLVQHVFVGLLSGAPLPPQAGHGTAAGLSHPGYGHQQAEWVPVDLQRTSGQPGPGPPAGLTQTLYAAGMLHPHRALQDVKQFSRVFLTSERHSRPSDRSKVCGRLQSVPCLGAEPTVEWEGVWRILQAGWVKSHDWNTKIKASATIVLCSTLIKSCRLTHAVVQLSLFTDVLIQNFCFTAFIIVWTAFTSRICFSVIFC